MDTREFAKILRGSQYSEDARFEEILGDWSNLLYSFG